MRTLFFLCILFGVAGGDSERRPPADSGLTESHIEFLKEHDAYNDFMDAFYPIDSTSQIN